MKVRLAKGLKVKEHIADKTVISAAVVAQFKQADRIAGREVAQGAVGQAPLKIPAVLRCISRQYLAGGVKPYRGANGSLVRILVVGTVGLGAHVGREVARDFWGGIQGHAVAVQCRRF